MSKFFKSNGGFTLIELLVVIAIIGLLAGVILISVSSARSKARDARRVADMHQIATAMELYFGSCSSYPPAFATSATSTTCTSGVSLGSYLANLPSQGTAGCSTSLGGTTAGTSANYGYTSGANTYSVYFCSEGAISGTPITGAASGSTAHVQTESGLTN